MVQDDGRGAGEDRGPKDLPRMDDRRVERSSTHHVTTENRVAGVEAEDAEDFDNLQF